MEYSDFEKLAIRVGRMAKIKCAADVLVCPSHPLITNCGFGLCLQALHIPFPATKPSPHSSLTMDPVVPGTVR
jgi:hypothetical protein